MSDVPRMHPRCPWLAILLLAMLPAAGARADDWVVATTEGCQVAVPSPSATSTFRWQGACVDGKAQGTGIVTSSAGGLMQGEFQAGTPVNTWGFWPLRFTDGSAVMAAHSTTAGVSTWGPLDLPAEQGKATPAEATPMVGEWEFLSGNGRCRERHSFRADGTFTVASGKEVMTGAYAVMQVANARSLLGFLKTDIAGNGERDCSGRRSPKAPDRTHFFYLSVESPDRIAICRVSKAPLTCVGTYTRLPQP